jgi:type IV fimbrial biogenesis protein FimT
MKGMLMTKARGDRMNQQGQSLLETMMALVIVGLATVMAVPSLLSLASRAHVQAAADEIASELRLARQLALAKRDRVRLVFDLEHRTIAAEFVNGGGTHHIYRYGDRGIILDRPTAGEEIVFHPSGRSATGTTIQLRSRDGQVRKLTVSLTGRVAVS